MRLISCLFTVILLPCIGLAQSAPNQTEVRAATTNGAAALREQVVRMPLTSDIRVEDFIQRTNSVGQLNEILQAAQPVGGSRWIDDHTCQVRLEIPASTISALLIGVADRDPQHSPIPPKLLRTKLSQWTRLKFSVVGSSANGDDIEMARPHDAAGQWGGVTEHARRAAVQQARADAVNHVTDSLKTISLGGDLHIKDALAYPSIADSLNSWLLRQPVTRIEFLDDLKVTVTVSLSPGSLAMATQKAVSRDPTFYREIAVEYWGHAYADIDQLPLTISGSGSVAGPVATTLPVAELPVLTPVWVDQQLQAEGIAQGTESRLKVGRLAESRAIENIRTQLLSLHVNPTSTLAQSAQADPAIKAAIARALLRARAYNVEYQADNSVKVRMSLNLRDAWEELRSNP